MISVCNQISENIFSGMVHVFPQTSVTVRFSIFQDGVSFQQKMERKKWTIKLFSPKKVHEFEHVYMKKTKSKKVTGINNLDDLNFLKKVLV